MIRQKTVSFLLWLLCMAFAFVPAKAAGISLTQAYRLFEITGGLKAPTDVAVAQDGRIYIVDGVHHAVKAFSSNGQFLYAFGKKGTEEGAFASPLGIAIDSTGNIFVADSGNHRIQVFDRNGRFAAALKIPPGNLHLADPTDVALDESKQRCYVVDNDNHRVLVYNLRNFELVTSYGSPGTQRREFRYPFLLAVSAEGNIHVVDVLNTRLQVLSPEGYFVTVIGKWGVEKGEFFRPKGVAIDDRGRVYVSDSYMGVIQVFDATGEFHSVIGDPKSRALKRFQTPTGIFIDNDNRLYVVETFANKVSVYRLEYE